MTKFQEKRFTPTRNPDRSISHAELARRWNLTFAPKKCSGDPETCPKDKCKKCGRGMEVKP